MSAFIKIAMSSCLVDCPTLTRRLDGQRGQNHDEWEGTSAGPCDPSHDGEEDDASEGDRGLAASWVGNAIQPADPGAGQGQGAEGVCAAAWGRWADVGGGEVG